MRLVVKQDDRTINEYQFEAGPVSIGRQNTNKICLADRVVSKNHAVIEDAGQNKWALQDLDSANKTYLNGRAIHRADLKTGDLIAVGGFVIEVSLDGESVGSGSRFEDTIQLEAALTNQVHDIVVRKPGAGHAPAMRLAAKRLVQFQQATQKICEAEDLDNLLMTLLDISIEQFEALNAWCALRTEPDGPMTCHAGKNRMGKSVELDDLALKDKIIQSVERGQFLVMPKVTAQIESAQRIRSALIASIIRGKKCYGVLYIDNAMIHEHYSLSDLDYLMLITIHTAAELKHILKL